MICDRYEQYALGKMEEKAFLLHMETCKSCREWVEKDDRLMILARSLKQSIEVPHLWRRIEQSLMEDGSGVKGLKTIHFHHRAYRILRMAAVLVIVVLLGISLWSKFGMGESKLLAGSVLRRVEKQEKAYMDAIAELEQKAAPHLAQLDVHLLMLYRERLEVIDAQIVHCQEALSTNPANGHIRRYMLAALQDKKETLKEILRS